MWVRPHFSLDFYKKICYTMIVHIPVDELEEPFRSCPINLTLLYNVCIDYADQTVNGILENQEMVLFRFKDVGFVNDNRYSTYEYSVGTAGLTFIISKTRK